MSVSPTSASDSPGDDAIDRLWAWCQLVKSGASSKATVGDDDIISLPDAEREVATAVACHLSSVCAFKLGELGLSRELAEDADWRWGAVLASDVVAKPLLTPRSNAFHMRLASRHAEYYRSVEKGTLAQWGEASRLKGRFLLAMVLQAGGETSGALAQASAIADEWRGRLSARLPGLGAIELACANWASILGRSALSEEMSRRLSTIADRAAAYPDDAPEIWSRPRGIESILRFGFAATPVAWL
ncbi:MAG: hypothetical protein E5V65_03445 [Mesorhizobium sp.]|nr:MAG: hypothetical protein E5V65_03445 [Mesorhizobium sp.]